MILKKLELNNKTLIKCINTQIMSKIGHFIGQIIFSVKCLNKIDGLIRKALYEINFIKKCQSSQRLYLKENYLCANLISARDIHLKTLIILYRNMKERNKEDMIRKVTEEIEIKWKKQYIKNKIKIHKNI